MQRCPSLVLFVVSSLCFTLSKAQKMNGSGLSCLRLSPADDGLARITFLVDVVGVRSLYVSRWSEYQRLETCERINDPVLTERYVSSCNRSDTQEQEIIQRFNISLLLAPDAPCALVSSSALKSENAAGKIRRKRRWIFPGTLWCGTASRAARYDQLGMFENADRCCRDHDHCLHMIPALTRNYRVFNHRFYTVSHCDCDLRFRQCLHDVNDSISNTVGYTFFTLMQIPCFEFKQPQRCAEKHWLGRCQVSKDAVVDVVFKRPLPYNSIKIKSRSEDGNRSTSGEKQHVTKGAVITPHTTSPKHEHTCTSKDLPTGDSSIRRRNDTKGCKIHRNMTGVTEIPSISRSHNTTTSLEKHLLNTSKTLSNEKRAGKKKSRGDTFQPQCKGCLKKNITYHVTTVKPTRKALEIYNKTTEPPKRRTMSSATSATSSTTDPTTVTSMNKQTDSRLLWTYTSRELTTTKASSAHAPRGLKLHIALRNLTDYQLPCKSLKHLDECRYKIRPLEKKYGLQSNETKTAYHCDCMSRTAVQIESLKQPSSVPSLLMDFVSQYCFKLPKEEKCNNRKSCSRGFTKASDLLEALKKIEEKDTAGVRKSGYARKRGIPVRLYKRCLRLEREADVIAQLT